MALRAPSYSGGGGGGGSGSGSTDKEGSVLFVSFNQDATCIALGTKAGVSIYSLDAHTLIYTYPCGAVSLASMLYRTSLLALVGAGDTPALTPRKCSVLNTSNSETIKDLSFVSSVLAVHMNKQRLVVVLEARAAVYALSSLTLLRMIDTPPNPAGVAALTPCDEPNLLALPSGDGTTGTLRVYDLLAPDGGGGGVLCELAAHKTPLSALAWSQDGRLLASGSHKGTVIRVHRLPAATRAAAFRRGTLPASLHSLAFSPAGMEPPLLCAASSHGTIHLFRLDAPGAHAGGGLVGGAGALGRGGAAGGMAGAAAAAASGILSTLMRVPAVSEMVEPSRAVVSIKLPVEGTPATCALLPLRSPGASQGDGTYTADAVQVVVATLGGFLYEYAVTDLSAVPDGPRCSLEGEWSLLGSGHAL